jgi:hypothetical protein
MDNERTIYVISGRSGDYEDTREWIIAAFDSETAAEEYKRICERKCKEAYEEFEQRRDAYDNKLLKRTSRVYRAEYPEPIKFPEDPDGYIESDTEYSIEQVRMNPTRS